MAVVLETFREQIYGGTRQRRWRRYKMSGRKEAGAAGRSLRHQDVLHPDAPFVFIFNFIAKFKSN